MSDDRLLDAAEIAARLGVKPSWVARAAREDRIPHVHLGKYARFRWPDVEALLDEEAKRSRRASKS